MDSSVSIKTYKESMGLNTNQLIALKSTVPEALICESDTSVPAESTIAQWALETGWNAHTPGNNCFGIKDYKDSFGRQLLWASEWFTDEELAQFVEVAGRTAAFDPTAPPRNGRKKYRCQDWFAAFKDLSDCFTKRAELFQTGVYAPILEQYKTDHDLNRFVAGIAQHYATDPRYANSVMYIISMPEVQSAIADGRHSMNLPT